MPELACLRINSFTYNKVNVHYLVPTELTKHLGCVREISVLR